MLEARNVSVYYGHHRAVEDASVTVDTNEIVVILGANGAGKSTFLRTIAGLEPSADGSSITIDGTDITHRPSHEIVEFGIALVPEDRGIFDELTVSENLLLGAQPKRARDHEAANMEKVLSLFPPLTQRLNQRVRTMSGGERQMVAIGRAMMSHPSILMLDEPSLGLSPLLCGELFRSLTSIKEADVGILLVEQNARQSLAIADRGYLLDNGQITHADTAEALSTDKQVIKSYLGGISTGAANITKAKPAQSAESNDGVEVPSSSSFTVNAGQRGSARTNIEDVLPVSISALVESATLAQSEHVGTQRSQSEAMQAAPPPVNTNGGGANGRQAGPAERDVESTGSEPDSLQRMLLEMEKAAADTLRRGDR